MSFRSAGFLFSLLLLLAGVGCRTTSDGSGRSVDLSGRTIRAVATTSIVADLVRAVGGERIEVTGLMGPGVDPHLYKASEGDVRRMADADLVFYNGLHLEGKMGDVLERMAERHIRTVAVTSGIDRSRLQAPPEFQGNYDPHVWFDVSLWAETVEAVRDVLIEADSAHAGIYQANARAYLAELDALEAYVRARIAELPPAQRVLITAHDAFNYFGRAYGFEVRGLQGISTAAEAGTADVQNLAAFVAERRVPALFVESSVPRRNIEAVQAAVRSRGFDVQIGGSLYSDALGTPGTPAATYTGMVRENVDTIVDGLLGKPTASASPL